MRRFAILLLCLALFSCSQEEQKSDSSHIIELQEKFDEVDVLYEKLEKHPTRLSYHIMLWANMIHDGKIREDIVAHATQTYYNSVAEGYDSLSTFSAACLSQVYMLKYNKDSVLTYLNRIDRQYLKEDLVLSAIVHNVAANNAIRLYLDYNTALEEYLQALKLMETAGSLQNQISLLNNISMIYYHKKDSTGLKFSNRAYALSRELGEGYWRLNSALVRSQLLYVAERYDESLKMLSLAFDLADEIDQPSTMPLIDMIYADIYARQMKIQEAASAYKKAYDNIAIATPDNALKIRKHYADFLYQRQKYEEALNLYKTALELSYQTEDKTYRQEILIGLSNVYLRLGRQKMAIKYYVNAQSYMDTLSANKRETEFYGIQAAYEKAKAQNNLKMKEISDRNHYLKIGFILTSILLLLILTFLLVRRFSAKKRLPGLTTETGELFKRMDRIIRNGELYRNPKFKIESLSAISEIDTKILERCIEESAALSFSAYLNKIRIEEASRLLSDPDSSIPLKSMYEYLGFTSSAIFYREFQKEKSCTPAEFRSRYATSL